MKIFSEDITAYIQNNCVCVIAVQMPDGTPHAATVHFAYDSATRRFIFETNKEYRKVRAFEGRKHVPASLVIGSTEGTMKTLQIDGVAELVPETDTETLAIYMNAFPEKQGKYDSKKLVFFTCTPTWWRYTDWTHADGKRVEISE